MRVIDPQTGKLARELASDLSESQFCNASFNAANLRDAKLSNSVFTDIGCEGTDFSGCVAKRADFFGANLAEALIPPRYE